jgi:deferrochelatase/peroxidase EfeB
LTPPADIGLQASRRRFLAGAAGIAGAVGATAAARSADATTAPIRPTAGGGVLAFHGAHQAGIVTPAQSHTYFAAFDVTAQKREAVAALLRAWTDAAVNLTRGAPVGDFGQDPAAPAPDSGEARDLAASRLTLTFGLGPSLFVKDGVDRFGLAARRPAALIDLPTFPGDQLVAARTGGDLSVQACADDPQAAFHAVRQLNRLADGVAKLRWVQAGFLSRSDPNATPRNLMGFKDGTLNAPVTDPKIMDQYVWVGDEGGWMRGGSYLVARPARIALEHWDRMKLAFQEQTMGREKASGAPIGGKTEFSPLDLDAVDKDGNPLIAENAHARLAAPQANDGVQILRRSYSYDNGVSFVAERWPPWRQGMELDAGLLFICYQRDPVAGFVKLFEKLSRFDMMNQFVTHIGGGLFACPGGVGKGRYLAQELFET